MPMAGVPAAKSPPGPAPGAGVGAAGVPGTPLGPPPEPTPALMTGQAQLAAADAAAQARKAMAIAAAMNAAAQELCRQAQDCAQAAEAAARAASWVAFQEPDGLMNFVLFFYGICFFSDALGFARSGCVSFRLFRPKCAAHCVAHTHTHTLTWQAERRLAEVMDRIGAPPGGVEFQYDESTGIATMEFSEGMVITVSAAASSGDGAAATPGPRGSSRPTGHP